MTFNKVSYMFSLKHQVSPYQSLIIILQVKYLNVDKFINYFLILTTIPVNKVKYWDIFIIGPVIFIVSHNHKFNKYKYLNNETIIILIILLLPD